MKRQLVCVSRWLKEAEYASQNRLAVYRFAIARAEKREENTHFVPRVLHYAENKKANLAVAGEVASDWGL